MTKKVYDPNNEKDFAEWEALSNKLLNDEDAAREAVREAEDAAAKARSEAVCRDDISAAEWAAICAEADKAEADHEKLNYQDWARRRIVECLDNDDVEHAISLAGDDPQLLRFIIRKISYRRGRGERINRPGEFPPHKQRWFDDLLKEAALLRKLWETQPSKVLSPLDTALKIVLRRRGGGDDEQLFDELKGWYSNRSRRKKAKLKRSKDF
jgi:hypothetical protein